jgi:FG-GAP-like repeat
VTRYDYDKTVDAGFHPYRYNNIINDLDTPTGLLGDVNGDGRVDVLARDGGGALWLYPNTGGSGTSTFGARSQVGTGWNTMTAINLGDLNGDGKVDIVSRDTGGALWLYPNTGGTGTNTFGARSQVGTGWNGITDID